MNAVAGSEKERSRGGRAECKDERDVLEVVMAWTGRRGGAAITGSIFVNRVRRIKETYGE